MCAQMHAAKNTCLYARLYTCSYTRLYTCLYAPHAYTCSEESKPVLGVGQVSAERTERSGDADGGGDIDVAWQSVAPSLFGMAAQLVAGLAKSGFGKFFFSVPAAAFPLSIGATP